MDRQTLGNSDVDLAIHLGESLLIHTQLYIEYQYWTLICMLCALVDILVYTFVDILVYLLV